MSWFSERADSHSIISDIEATSPSVAHDSSAAFHESHEHSFYLEEVFVTLALFVFSFIVFATPCRPLRVALHVRIDPAGWFEAIKQLKRIRSRSDVTFWWNQWKDQNTDIKRQMHQQRWDEFIRSERIDTDNHQMDQTIRTKGSNNRQNLKTTRLTSLFQPLSETHGKFIHPSSSDGFLLRASPKIATFLNGYKREYYSEDDSWNGADHLRETDHARFEHAWHSYIHSAEYKRLVLPPECKLLDSSHRRDFEHVSQHESPWQTTITYLLSLYSLWMKFFSVEGYKQLLLWCMHVFRYKIRKQRGLPVDDDDEEEEDDDGSVATVGTEGRISQTCQSPIGKRCTKKGYVTNCVYDDALDNSWRESEGKIHTENENDSSLMNTPITNHAHKQEKNTAVHLKKRSDTTDDSVSVLHKDMEHIPKHKKTLTVSSISVNTYSRSHQKFKKHHTADSHRLPPTANIGNNDLQLEKISPMPSPKFKHSHAESNDVPSLNFFDTANSDLQLRDMSRAVPIPDANGYIIGDEFLSSSSTPLLVFVNSRSGSQQGDFLIAQFRRLLNPIQVWDLGKGRPNKVLKSFSVLSRFQILICGGDGTISWIISVLEKMNLKRWPPIGILPLGTGNDLSRVHGWGGGYNNESLLLVLRQISEAYVSMLDLWELEILTRKGNRKNAKSFINYLGVGVDAQAALQVHMLREIRPKLFFSRFYNKVWYAIAGGEEAIKSSCANLPQQITLVADGVEIPLPPDSQGIIFLNIDSYCGGVPIWSKGQRPRRRARSHSEGDSSRRTEDFFVLESETSQMSLDERLEKVTSCDLPSSCQDGLLDVVSIRGTFHLGQIRVGLSNAQLLCQCREAIVTIKKKVAVQVDGEPWRQSQSILQIKRKKDRASMLNRSADDSGGIEPEVAKLLNWASEREIIDRNQYVILTEEFSRRMECKKRRQKEKRGFSFVG